MAPKNSRERTEALSLCADLHPDDGPPTRRRKESHDDRSDERKTMQLCAQVRRSLHDMISARSSSLLDELMVEAVEPNPNASRLRVVISVPPSCAHPIPSLHQRLTAMAGLMRAEIASQINRKRVPLLTFELIPREEDA
ncbi:MAG: ribosome-binding factor A [Planctomycetota bacterium]